MYCALDERDAMHFLPDYLQPARLVDMKVRCRRCLAVEY
jgi:hypothetical protein